MSFVTCPLDIIRAILKHCDKHTLTSLALVCHSLAVEVPVFLYRVLDVRGHDSDGSTTYWELLRRLALMDPPIVAQHVRILRFGHAYNGVLRAAVRRMTHLRHVEYHNDIGSDEETALGVIKGADLRFLEWRWGRKQDLVLTHVATHYPNLIELNLQWHVPRGADDYNDPPVLPARFPALQSLRAEWAVAFLFLHQHGHVLVHLDIDQIRRQSPCPSWIEQPLPSLRYLRIRGSHTFLGSDLRRRIAASAPHLEVLVMAIDDCNFAPLHKLCRLRRFIVDLSRVQVDDPLIAATADAFFRAFDKSFASVSLIVCRPYPITPVPNNLRRIVGVTYWRGGQPPTVEDVDYPSWIGRE